ncbi:hypothetical protein CLU79DRAFT_725755 [Phycomyces nitens]|nr:hypothetical protein CLU79DRAFT_725755 [Phycomyces nitens]
MLALQPNFQDSLMPGAALLPTVGDSQSYYFYQKLSLSQSTTSKYESPKQIVPPVPRDHLRAPLNSPLSPIRTQKRPDESYVSSPADHSLGGSEINSLQPPNHRERKVSFNEQVVVVCTVIQTDQDESDEEEDEDYYYHDPNHDYTDHYPEGYNTYYHEEDESDDEAASYRKKIEPVIPPISANNPIIINNSREISHQNTMPTPPEHESTPEKRKFGIKMTMLVKRIGRHLKQHPGQHQK